MKTKNFIFLLIYLLHGLLIISCNEIQSQNLASKNLQIKDSIKADDSPCKDSFYIAILDKATVDANAACNRFHFDFYETKVGSFNIFNIEGWHKDNGDPQPITLSQLPAGLALSNPYHFRDIQISKRDIDALIRTIPDHDCDYQIHLIPFQDPTYHCLNINAQIFYDCSHDATKNYVPGSTKTLNPCPPKQPQ
jgi:hypothetical protein